MKSRFSSGPNRITHSKQTSQEGFTLVEMLVVLAIFTLVVASVGGSIARRDNAPGVLDYAQKVQTLVYRARADAISTGNASQVWVDVKRKEIRYAGSDGILLPETMGIRIIAGVELISADGRAELVFLADGSSSGMDIYFSEAEAGQSGNDRKVAHLRVNWLTGLPTVLDGG